MISFYGFNPQQNPMFNNLFQAAQPQQQPVNPLFSRLGGDNSFSRLQTTYSNVFNPEIIQRGMDAYNQGMQRFTSFDQAKFDADLKAKQDAEAAAKAAQTRTGGSGLFAIGGRVLTPAQHLQEINRAMGNKRLQQENMTYLAPFMGAGINSGIDNRIFQAMTRENDPKKVEEMFKEIAKEKGWVEL